MFETHLYRTKRNLIRVADISLLGAFNNQTRLEIDLGCTPKWRWVKRPRRGGNGEVTHGKLLHSKKP